MDKTPAITMDNIVAYLRSREVISPLDRVTHVLLRPADHFVAEVRLIDGWSLFVKQGRWMSVAPQKLGPGAFPPNIKREALFYDLVGRFPPLVRTRKLLPPVALYDAENDVLVTKGHSQSEDLGKLFDGSRNAHVALARQLGRAVATFHGETREWVDLLSQEGLDRATSQFDQLVPLKTVLDRLTPEYLRSMPDTVGELASILQHTPNLREALGSLRTEWATRCLVHGDLRLANVIRAPIPDPSAAPLVILDWEHCYSGDPTWDLGTIIGDYLAGWIFSIRVHPQIDPSHWLEQAQIPFVSAQRSIRAFWQAYLDELRVDGAPDFWQVMRFCGLYLLSRSLSMSLEYEVVVPNTIIAAQIGGRLATQPHWAAKRLAGKGTTSL